MRSPSCCPSCGKLNIIAGSAGGVPERLKGADCKSVGLAPTLVRIQPPPPVVGCLQKRKAGVCKAAAEIAGEPFLESGGCSSMVEQKPSKLMTRVRFPSPAPAPRIGEQLVRNFGPTIFSPM